MRDTLSRPHVVVMGRVTYQALAAVSVDAADETLGADGREPIFAGWPRAGLELADVRLLDARLVLLEYRLAP